MTEKKKQVSTRFDPKEADKLDEIIRGSYDDFVRLERRNLLAVSVLIFLAFFGNIVGNNIVLLGISFPNIDTGMMFIILLAGCVYFLIAYAVYAYPGFRCSWKKWKGLTSGGMVISGEKHRWPIEINNFFSSMRYFSWLFVNYIFPIIMGFVALALGLSKIV